MAKKHITLITIFCTQFLFGGENLNDEERLNALDKEISRVSFFIAMAPTVENFFRTLEEACKNRNTDIQTAFCGSDKELLKSNHSIYEKVIELEKIYNSIRKTLEF